MNVKGEEELTPALTLDVKDTIGAGDAFFALASLSAKLELPVAIGSLLGNLAGAIAANTLGNAEPVDKARLLKFATTVLKF
jgi:sugar/nucleoside kinase (ribokinase family)